MTITAIGHITRDTLIFPHQEWHIVQSLGGILYTVSALAYLIDEKIRPVCNVGEDVFEQVVDSLKGIPNMDLVGLRRAKGNHFHCYIMYGSEYGTQYDEGPEVPISFNQVRPFLGDSRFVLVSFMTGYDMAFATMKRIKDVAQCPVYLDYHILSLQRDQLGNRYLRRRKNWLDWCSLCDHLQMNQFEAESLSNFRMESERDILRFSAPILERGVSSVVVTMGGKGALVCWKDKLSGPKTSTIEAIQVPRVIDTTGCGDVFAAGFIVHFLKTNRILESYEFANRLAALKCGFNGFQGLKESLDLLRLSGAFA